jgi:hypothetical protein
MKVYSFYDEVTGAFANMHKHIPAWLLSDNTPPGTKPIEGAFDPHSQRVDIDARDKALIDARKAHSASYAWNETAELEKAALTAVVDYQPPQPSSDHEWNAASKRWQLKGEASIRLQRIAQADEEIARLESQQHRYTGDAAVGLIDDEGRRRLLEIRQRIAELRLAKRSY